MKNKTLVVTINKPLKEVFEYSLNPENTPKWLDSVTEEERSENPTKLGTKYRNRGKDSDWTNYTITEFEPNKMFVFSKDDNSYSVKYTFKSINESTTELEYYEWVNEGILENPFTQGVLEKFKVAVENSL